MAVLAGRSWSWLPLCCALGCVGLKSPPPPKPGDVVPALSAELGGDVNAPWGPSPVTLHANAAAGAQLTYVAEDDRAFSVRAEIRSHPISEEQVHPALGLWAGYGIPSGPGLEVGIGTDLSQGYIGLGVRSVVYTVGLGVGCQLYAYPGTPQVFCYGDVILNVLGLFTDTQ